MSVLATRTRPEWVAARDAVVAGTPGPSHAGPRRPGRLGLVLLASGLVLTGSLSWLTWAINRNNETRLLHLQVQEAATALDVLAPLVEVPLASAASTSVNDADPAHFDGYMASYVGKDRPFVDASLWRVDGSGAQLLASTGAGSELSPGPSGQRFLTSALTSGQLSVVGHLGADHPRLGFASGTTGGSPGGGVVVYAETDLSQYQDVSVSSRSGFADLRYGLFLGRTTRPSALIATSGGTEPITGRRAQATVPFGDTVFTLVATPERALGGPLLQRLWWIVGLLGLVLSVGVALTADFLVRRRREAEALAVENRRLFAEQHSLAEKLQRVLLPEEMPTVAGVEIESRYVAGVKAMDIGGDWYDVIACPDGSFLFVVGDVSGRGLGAATFMAALRYATRAYAAEGDRPAEILTKLGSLLTVDGDGHFATVLCGRVEAGRHLTLANAGHLPPILVTGGESRFVQAEVGPPVGVVADVVYPTSTVELPDEGMLIVFTDGLVETRGEDLDEGLARLRSAVSGRTGRLGTVLEGVLTDMKPNGPDDDTALLGLRWARRSRGSDPVTTSDGSRPPVPAVPATQSSGIA